MEWECASSNVGDKLVVEDVLYSVRTRPCVRIVARHANSVAVALLTLEDAQAMIDHIASLMAGPLGKLALDAAKKEQG